jgi:AcrR family transcriptional regulator
MNKVADTMTPERIVLCALHLIESEGIAALNMRSLAAKMGVGTMTLYYYIPNKQELLTRVAEFVWSKIETGSPDFSWDENARVVARSTRDVYLCYPHTYGLLLTSPPPQALTTIAEQLAISLKSSGAEASIVEVAQHTLLRFVFGWCFGEILGPNRLRRDRTKGGRADREFELALEAVVAGLKTLITGPHD